MATVIQDLVESSSFEIAKAWKYTRVFHVSGLTGNASGRLHSAVLSSEIPVQGDPHPDIAGIYARTLTVTPESPTSARVTVTYEPYDPAVQPPNDAAKPTIEVGATISAVETNMDINGELIKLSYTQSKENPDTHQMEDTKVNCGGKVNVQRPQPVVRMSRRESASPYQKALEYVGKKNSGSFMGAGPGYWLCTKIVGRSNDGGKTYDVEYEFQYSADTWDPTVVAIDKDTGEPPVDANGDTVLVEDTGYKRIVVYEEISFGGLNL